MTVAKHMEIFWDTPFGNEQVKGISFFGYFVDDNPTILDDCLRQLWMSLNGEIAATLVAITEPGSYQCVDRGSIFNCHVRLQQFPSDNEWQSAIEGTLRWIVGCGARVAWCGGEDCTISPDVLDPNSMAGNVYAGYGREAGFLCKSPRLSDELVFLPDENLSLLLTEITTKNIVRNLFGDK